MNRDSRRPLPTGWVWTTLGDIRVDRARSVLPSKSPAEGFELYSVPSFASGVPELVKGREVGSNKQTVEPGTVLLCKINPRINRSWVVADHSDHKKIASTEWIPFFPIDGVDPFYLCYFLRLDDFRNHLAANASGVGGSLMRARLWSIEDYLFPLAPLPEQRRIVAEIEKHFTRLDAAVASLQRARANLKRYRASVLTAACEGRLVPTEAELARREGRDHEPASALLERILKERLARWEAERRRGSESKKPQPPDTSSLPSLPKGWTWATWAQLSPRVTVGHVGPMKHEYVGSGIPFLRSQNVRENRLDPEGLQYITSSFHHKLDKSKLQPGDLVVIRSGSVGVTCVIPPDIGEANCADLVIIKKPLHFQPKFGAYYMNSLARRLVRAGQVGVALIHFNTKSVEALPVPVPPVAEQNRIVAEVERQMSVFDAAEVVVEANLKRAERLRQAILRCAFEGKLVPQDPTDEPASVLLERIRAERERAGRNTAEVRRKTGRRRKAQEVSA